MKIGKFLSLFFVVGASGMLFSCSSDEGSSIDNETSFELELGMGLNSFDLTRADGDYVDACLDFDDFLNLVEEGTYGRLKNVEAIYKIERSDGKIFNSTVNLRAIVKGSNTNIPNSPVSTRDQLVTDVITLLHQDGKTFKLTELIVKEKDGVDVNGNGTPGETLFNSINDKMVDTYGELLAECLAPKCLNYEKFGKQYTEICLHCSNVIDPADFGFSILENKLLKSYSIPFIVDICSHDGDKDFLGSGIYEIAKKNSNNTWTVVKKGPYGHASLVNNGYSYSSEAKLGHIVFTDDLNVPDDQEIYSIKLINYQAPLIGYQIETINRECDPKTINGSNYTQYLGVSVAKLKELYSTSTNPGWIQQQKQFILCSVVQLPVFVQITYMNGVTGLI